MPKSTLKKFKTQVNPISTYFNSGTSKTSTADIYLQDINAKIGAVTGKKASKQENSTEVLVKTSSIFLPDTSLETGDGSSSVCSPLKKDQVFPTATLPETSLGTENASPSLSSLPETRLNTQKKKQASGLKASTFKTSLSNCSSCQEKDKKLSSLQDKYQSLKQKYFQICQLHSESTMKLHAVHKLVPDDMNDLSDNLLSTDEMYCLMNVPGDKSYDSGFIRKCLEYLYKEDVGGLTKRTLKGTKEKSVFCSGSVVHYPSKQPITPLKLSAIKKAFIARLKKYEENIDSAEFHDRIKDGHVNRLITVNIKSISDKYINKERHSEIALTKSIDIEFIDEVEETLSETPEEYSYE